MKEIPLTTDHKSKLIEMCKVLFPEYETIQFGLDEEICDGWSKSSLILDKYDFITENCIIIHWLEFCLIYLIPKLDVRETMFVTLSIHQVKPYSGCDFSHPIDYLYGKFKQQIK